MEFDKDFIQIAFYLFLLLNDYFNILSIIFNINKYFDYAYGKKFRNKIRPPSYQFSKPNSVAIKPPLLGSISKKIPEMNHTFSKETNNKNENKSKSSSRQDIQKMFLELDKSGSTHGPSSSSSSKNRKQQHTLLKMLLEYPPKKIKDKLNFYDTCGNGTSFNDNNCSNTSNGIRSKNVKKSRTPFTSHNVRKTEKEDLTDIPIEANVGHLSNVTGKSIPSLRCNCDYHRTKNGLNDTMSFKNVNPTRRSNQKYGHCPKNSDFLLHKSYRNHLVNPVFVHPQHYPKETTTHLQEAFRQPQNRPTEEDDICCNLLVDPSSPLRTQKRQYHKMAPSNEPIIHSRGYGEEISTQKPERINKMVQNVLKDAYVQNPCRETKNVQTEILETKISRRQFKPDKNIYLVSINNNNHFKTQSTTTTSCTRDNATLSTKNYESKCDKKANGMLNHYIHPKLVPYSISSSDDASQKRFKESSKNHDHGRTSKDVMVYGNGPSRAEDFGKNTSKCVDIFYNFETKCKISIKPKLDVEEKRGPMGKKNHRNDVTVPKVPTVLVTGLEEAPFICIFDGISSFKSSSEASLDKNDDFGKELIKDDHNSLMVLLKQVDTSSDQLQNYCCIQNKPDGTMSKTLTKTITEETKRPNKTICNFIEYINPLNKGVQISSDYISRDNLKIGYIISRIEDLLNVLNDNISKKLTNVKRKEVNWKESQKYDQQVMKIKTRREDVKQLPKSCSFSNGTDQKNMDNVQEDTWKTKWLKRLCKHCELNKHLTYPTLADEEIKKSTPKKHEEKFGDPGKTKYNSAKIFHRNHGGGGGQRKEKNKVNNFLNSKSHTAEDWSEYSKSKVMLKKCFKCRRYFYVRNRRSLCRSKSNENVSKGRVRKACSNEKGDSISSQEIILRMMDPRRKEDQKRKEKDLQHTAQSTVDLREDPFLKMMEPKRTRVDQKSKQVFRMNGLNGHSNGDLNGCDIITQNQQKGCWTVGLINSKFKYLTAETFGFKINANGSSLKKKQIWTLEPDLSTSGESYIYLKSHLDKYLAVDSFGNVTCENEEKDPGSKFLISVAEDGTGRWAFRNVVRGYFLGASQDKLTCTAKIPGDAEFWLVHLAARPQVNLRSVGRKRFAHLSENQDEIYVDANIPWGEDTLFTLEFRADESGKYALHTCNNKYLSLGGKLVDKCTSDCLFTAEYHSGYLALRDKNGSYLSPIGSKAVLKTRSNTVTKDELFSLEDSLPQASFVAALNAKYVSVKQGVDVTANQDEISDHETFQLEFDWSTKRWYIRTMQDRYWTLETGGGIQAVGDKRSSNALFDLIWQGDGSVAFRANNGRYVTTKRSGHLYANSDAVDENSKYFFYLINRPILVLKSEQGFVGYKSGNNTKLECNKAMYETIQVERAEKGIVYFKGQNGKYWHCDSEGVTADSDVPEGFYLELREPTRLSIKSVSGSYLTASKNGVFRLGDSSYESATQWEY